MTSGRQDSNLRPPAPKAGAQPNWASTRSTGVMTSRRHVIMTPGLVKMNLSIGALPLGAYIPSRVPLRWISPYLNNHLTVAETGFEPVAAGL